MTAPWPAEGYPTTSAPALVPQQGTGLRVLRIVLVALLVSGWYSNATDRWTSEWTPPGGTTLTIDWAGSGLVYLAILILLISGPQPRWATKWAWFWLLNVGPMAAVFLLLEPVPVWQSEPVFARRSRLTGGWALLLALFGGAILGALAALVVLPWLAPLLGVWGMGSSGT